MRFMEHLRRLTGRGALPRERKPAVPDTVIGWSGGEVKARVRVAGLRTEVARTAQNLPDQPPSSPRRNEAREEKDAAFRWFSPFLLVCEPPAWRHAGSGRSASHAATPRHSPQRVNFGSSRRFDAEIGPMIVIRTLFGSYGRMQ